MSTDLSEVQKQSTIRDDNSIGYKLTIKGVDYVTKPKINSVWRCDGCVGRFYDNLCHSFKMKSDYNCSAYNFVWDHLK